MKKIAFTLIVLLMLQTARSQSNLDFWLGDWDVFTTTSNNLIGENHVTKILDEKVITEKWTDVFGTKGRSFTLYDSSLHCWKQTWVDNTGAIAEFTGSLNNDTMFLFSNPKLNKAGKPVIHRMTIIKVSADELLQKEESSVNNSFSWQTNYSFKYKRQSNYTLTNKNFKMKLYALKLKVADLEAAKKFYVETLGFSTDNSYKAENEVRLVTNSYKIILSLDKNMKILPENVLSSVSFCIMVNDIDEALKTYRSKGVRLLSDQKRKEGVGYSIKIFDPFNNQLSVMQQTTPNTQKIIEPKVYNCGYYVPSMEKARKFYSGILGFVELTDKYLPSDMPLYYADKSFNFMLHENRPEFKHVITPNARLVFAVSDMDEVKIFLRKNNISFTEKNGIITFTDNSHIETDIIKMTTSE